MTDHDRAKIPPAGRAFEPYQKKQVTDRLHSLWARNPDLRLGQLIGNAYSYSDVYTENDSDAHIRHVRLYYEEDWPFIEALEKFYGTEDDGLPPLQALQS